MLGLSPEPAGLKSFLKVELNLSQACSKEGEQKPTALLRCVLQALAIQGDLQHKIKLFSKSKLHFSLLNVQYFHHLFMMNPLSAGYCRPGQVLLKTMLKPLVIYPSLSVTVAEQEDEGVILALQCLEESHEERSTPSQVYSKLLLVLKTLHTHLLGTVWLGLCRNYASCFKAALSIAEG